jgi:muramoyltetrapeptide carboxypeptidase
MKIGIIAPSMPSEGARKEKIERGIAALIDRGDTVELGASVWSSMGYKSASAAERAKDLEKFLVDPTIDVIVATTGGYNSNEMLDSLDLGPLPCSGKIFVGYSDCTALSLALEAAGVCQTVCGPMLVDVVSEPQCFDRLFSLLEKGQVAFSNSKLVWENTADEPRSACKLQLLQGKATRASGGALGGNLSTFCLLLGTRFMPSCAGRVLFLEYDKEEARALPSLERYLWQIRLSGIFSQLSGLVFGAVQSVVAAEETEIDNVMRILTDVTAGFSFPVVYNAQFGHLYPSWIIPNGWKTIVEEGRSDDGDPRVCVTLQANGR